MESKRLAQTRDGVVEHVVARRLLGGLQQRAAREPRDHRLALRADVVALLVPCLRDAARAPAASDGMPGRGAGGKYVPA